MKIMFKYIVVLCSLMLIVTACFEDESLSYSVEHPNVKIYHSKDKFNIISGDVLEVNIDSIVEIDSEGRRLIIGPDSEKYNFTWVYKKIFDKTISTGYKLNSVIKGNFRKGLVFVVKDISTGLEYHKNFIVNIGTKNGSGLIVVDTKDNVHSSFNEILNMYVSPTSQDKMKVLRNVYENLTGTQFKGIVTNLSYSKTIELKSDLINVFTESSGCFVYDGYYNKLAEGDDIFFIRPDNYNISEINKSFGCVSILNSEGHIQLTSDQSNYVFYFPYITKDGSDYRASKYRTQPNYNCATYIYDEIGNRFMKTVPFGNKLYPVKGVEDFFDYSNIGDYDAIYMGEGYEKARDSYIVTVLKSESGSNFFAYIFNASKMSHNGQKIIDLSNCTDINRASGFATSPLEKILYYTVENKVYAVSLAGTGIPTSYIAYTTPELGDGIESIKIWKGNDPTKMMVTDVLNPTGDPVSKNAQQRMLVITTYNNSSAEGKVILLPIQILNSSRGGIENNVDNHRVFGGFGRILATDDTAYPLL